MNQYILIHDKQSEESLFLRRALLFIAILATCLPFHNKGKQLSRLRMEVIPGFNTAEWTECPS